MLNLDIIKEGYKKRGIDALQQCDYNAAIQYFNEWQYVYANNAFIDTYTYDSDILSYIDSELYKFKYNPKLIPRPDGKICIVYLVQGILSSSSIVPKIIINLSEYHDKSKFEIHIFVTETWLDVYRSSGNIFIKKFKDAGCQMHYAPLLKFGFSKVKNIAHRINALNPHILVTTAALADFNHYFIVALKPAPITMGFILGCHSQFVSYLFDYGISWLHRIKKTSPIPCLDSGQLYIPDEIVINKNISRSDYNIPKDAIVITSAGRYTKFQDERILKLLIELMKELPNLHYLVVGPAPNQSSIFNNIPEDIEERIHIFRWSDNYENYLSVSDIYLDTFPSGGGITLHDAALLHLPIISFADSSSLIFDQSDWNPAQDLFYPGSIILINRDDLNEIKPVIKDLYYYESKRRDMGDKAYQNIIFSRLQIKKNVEKIENLYIDFVDWGKI